jgi:1,4-alpha-glucan branching enzyme
MAAGCVVTLAICQSHATPAATATNQVPSAAPANPTPAEPPGVVEDFQPSSLNQTGRQYPQINSEHRVRARVTAPLAQSVQLDIGGKKYPLTRDASGVWTGVSQPQDEGFHYYQLVVDGAQVPDPNTLYFWVCSMICG